MGKVTRTSQAWSDLAEIGLYIAEDDPFAADKWLDGVELLLDQILANPELGEAYLHRIEGMRRFPYGNYVLYYLVRPDGIVLYRVLHGARDADSFL